MRSISQSHQDLQKEVSLHHGHYGRIVSAGVLTMSM